VSRNQLSINFVNDVTAAIQNVVGSGQIALHEPNFDGNEWKYIKDCLDSNYVSSVGKYVDEFEQALVTYTGAKYAISVVNGTAALQIALKLAGVEQGDEVLIPALTFVATANAVSYLGAIPHFVDSEMSTLGINTGKLREYLESNTELKAGACFNKVSNRPIRALVPMHTFGHPSLLDEILLIGQEFNLVIVEDAAESLGSQYKGKHTGTFGKLGALSFNGNKIITTGGGGAILTDNESLARRAKHITTTAKLPHKWEFDHDEIGFNFRMPNLNAALGLAQLEKIDEKLAFKRALFEKYSKAFENVDGISLHVAPEHCLSNYWLNAVILEDEWLYLRDQILEETNQKGIGARPAWKLVSELKPYKDNPRMNLEMAQKLVKKIINIPSGLNIK
jgi:perosamine synthetase